MYVKKIAHFAQPRGNKLFLLLERSRLTFELLVLHFCHLFPTGKYTSVLQFQWKLKRNADCKIIHYIQILRKRFKWIVEFISQRKLNEAKGLNVPPAIDCKKYISVILFPASNCWKINWPFSYPVWNFSNSVWKFSKRNREIIKAQRKAILDTGCVSFVGIKRLRSLEKNDGPWTIRYVSVQRGRERKGKLWLL